ncbi:MAG: GHKL domain-containing protein [Lachnospiraceae bacterium]|nr:GHKL domain-containing protein [Lachnospiraceae bacterium]
MMSNVLPTIPRFYTAIAQWSGCMLYLLVYYKQKKRDISAFILIAAAALLCLSLELILTGGLEGALWILAMIGSAGLMYLFMFVCMDAPWLTVGYCTVRAFVLSELAASVEWQLYYFFVSSGMESDSFVEFGFMLPIYAVVYICLFLLEKSAAEDGRCETIHIREFITAFCIGVLIFVISNLSFLTLDTPFSGSVELEIYNIRTFVDIGGVAVLFAYHMQLREQSAKYELNVIQNVLEMQYTQYKQSRESIEMVNRKYHDLKHQIAALRAEPDAAVREAFLDAMEEDIRDYEAQNKTGNSVLDTVLTSKNLYCQKHKIILTTVADGSLLNFMDAMDICTIFGNALDNAIEAAREIKDTEKRLIHLTLTSQRGFVLIRVENYFERHLKFEGGMPLSTKGDERFHGYGVKSIRYSAEKYGGTVSISTEKNWFDLKVLIPAERQKK